MKTPKFVILFFLFFSLMAQGQVYDFPIKPGTPEWEKIDSYNKMVEVCQIPENILSNMSTDDLLETCLNHPFKINIYLYSTFEESFQVMAKTFNSFKEILKRNDIGEALLKKADSIQIQSKSIASVTSIDSKMDKIILKLILTSSNVNQAISDNQRNKIIKLLDGSNANISTQSSAVYTPKGSIVSDTGVSPEELSDAEIIEYNNYTKALFPQATLLKNSTTTYNCHAYAWHITEGGNAVWMGFNTNPTSVYWTDGSYSPINCTEAGLKVSYANDNHSAVTTETEGVFISKWGPYPLMKHKKDYCPYNSTSLKYYIKNLPSQSFITGKYAQNGVWSTLGTVNFVKRSIPVTLNVDYPNAYKVTWELISGGSDIAWGPNNGKVTGITLYSSTSATLRATAYTPCNRTTTDFSFSTVGRYSIQYNPESSLISVTLNDESSAIKKSSCLFTIVNTEGVVAKKVNISGDTTIDISDLSEGVYYINITDGTIDGTYKQSIMKR